jgi:signal transduction histidine kinase
MKNWFNTLTSRLYKYRPRFEDWRFWLVQISAIGIAILHLIAEQSGDFSQLHQLGFVPLSLMVIPLVIAGIIFGSIGSITTSIWIIIISLPNLMFDIAGPEKYGEMFQLLILVAVGIFIGKRVDLERSLVNKVESASTALSASEAKYRSLFDASPIAILAIDNQNRILDANPSAGLLFNQYPEALKKMLITDLNPISTDNNWWESPLIVIQSKTGTEIYLEPALTQIWDNRGNIITQVLLKNITEEKRREAGLKAYAAHIIQAQEDERQHIARELHDQTIQNLALLCRQLDNIGATSEALPASTVNELGKARKIAENVVGELRNFTRALRPPILDDLGVVASIRRLLLDFMERTNIKGELRVTGNERRLTRDLEVGMFRIAQEALWNVEKHAKASSVTVVIGFNDNEIKLHIVDNGTGFKVPPVVEDLSTIGKLGLLGMKERTELLGGKLEILSTSEKGTTIAVSIPNPQPSVSPQKSEIPAVK